MLPRDIYMSFEMRCLYNCDMEITDTAITSFITTFTHRLVSVSVSMSTDVDRDVMIKVVGKMFHVAYEKRQGYRIPQDIYTDAWHIKIIPNVDPRSSKDYPCFYAHKPYTYILANGDIEEIERDLVLLKFRIDDLMTLIEIGE